MRHGCTREISMRKSALVVSLAVTGIVALTATTPNALHSRENAQEAFKAQHGKYQHQPITKDSDGITRKVDEFQHPDGTTGYVIYETRTNKNGSVDKRITSHDTDIESTGWLQIKPPPFVNSTSTSI